MPVYGLNKTVEVALTVGTDAYTANDVVGGLITFDVASAGGAGAVRRIKLVDDDNEDAVFKLYLFDDTPSTIADDAAFAPTVADLKKLIDIIDIAAGDYVTLNSNSVAIIGKHGDTPLGIEYNAPKGDLFGYLVCTGTPTYTAATDLTIEITVWAY